MDAKALSLLMTFYVAIVIGATVLMLIDVLCKRVSSSGRRGRAKVELARRFGRRSFVGDGLRRRLSRIYGVVHRVVHGGAHDGHSAVAVAAHSADCPNSASIACEAEARRDDCGREGASPDRPAPDRGGFLDCPLAVWLATGCYDWYRAHLRHGRRTRSQSTMWAIPPAVAQTTPSVGRLVSRPGDQAENEVMGVAKRAARSTE